MAKPIFTPLNDVEYEVYHPDRNLTFIGELNDALDCYSAWMKDQEPDFEIEELEDEFTIHFTLDNGFFDIDEE